MKKIQGILEYLLVFLFILEFNTPYLIFTSVYRVILFFSLIALSLLVLLSGKMFRGKDLFGICIYWMGSVLPLLMVPKEAFVNYLARYMILLPLLWLFLSARKRMGSSAYHSVFFKYSNLVVLLAAVSLVMWLVCSVLQLVSPTNVFPSYWTIGGELKFIPTYYGIYFETQTVSLFGIENMWRNSGIFQEGPMYNMILCIALSIECFIRPVKSKYKIVILVLTIISTMTTTGQIILMLFMVYYSYKKISKYKFLLILIAPVILCSAYVGAGYVIEDKQESRAGANSVDIRTNSILLSIEAGMERPLLGAGLMSTKVKVRQKLHKEHSNSLFDLFAYGGIYTLILYVGALVVIPMLYYKRYGDLNWLLVMLSFFVIFCVTYSIYKYLTFLFIAWGLSNINMQKIGNGVGRS